jgi:hypothetical protein
MTDNRDCVPRPGRVTQATVICTVIVLGVNVFLGWEQFVDHFRWGAMGIMFEFNPIANLILLALFGALTPIVRRTANGASVKLYIWVAMLLPLFMIPCQFFVPFNLDELLK